MNSKKSEKRIEDTIGDTAVAQSLIALANKAGINLSDIAALLENTIDPKQITQWLQSSANLNGVATLLGQEIESSVITQLINNQADLRDIATNSQLLLNGDIRVDLINKWLKNKTHLNDAIAIMRQGVDLNLIGTNKRKVGDFIGLIGATPNEVLSRIPEDAEIEQWVPNLGGALNGMKFYWKDLSGKAWRLRMHGPDPSAPAGSNAASGWVLRVQHRKRFMDAVGDFIRPNSPDYTEDKANETHIPIQPPPTRSVP